MAAQGFAPKPTTIQGPWSYSRLTTWEQCPLKAKLKYIDGLKEPGSPAMDRGTAIHKDAEDFVTGACDELPESLKLFYKQFAVLRGAKAECELEWGFTASWEPTSFFAKDAWCRMKTDVSYSPRPKVRSVIDHKTGKIYESHKDQLGLYAVGEFIMHPEVEVVIAQDWYLDQDAANELEFQRAELPMMKGMWEDRVEPMFKATDFPPKANFTCKWCAFRKAAGGPCVFALLLSVVLTAMF